MKAMPKIILLLSGLAIFLGCSQGQSPSLAPSENAKATPAKHTYPALPLPDFLEALLTNHLPTVKSIENQAFTKYCEANQVATDDSLNQSHYFRIQFLHDLFTSTGAYDCNMGGILKLPYFWHWTKPNPRHEIEYLTGKSQKKLTEIKPPSGFQRYKSLADIDRTPSLYLSDMVTESPKYRHPDCGDFYSFGWCSEREMAFSALLNLMGFESKVVVRGNHSWSEVMVEMNTAGGSKKWFTAKVDNTFDAVEFAEFDGALEVWRKDFGTTKTDRWYNEKASSKMEYELIKAIIITPQVSGRIEGSAIDFYEKLIEN